MRKKFIYLLIAAIGVVAVLSGSAEGKQSLEKSVVMIRSVRQDFDYLTGWKQRQMAQGIGTGFIIAGNRILTNAHNVSNNKYLEIKKENIAKRYPAKVAFIGHDCDLAVLTVDDNSFFDGTAPLKLADIPKVNTTVSTYGFPLGGTHISVTKGVVSRIEMDIYVHSGADSHLVIQTDAAINPGNSGGPVMQNGKVVGVAFQGLRQAENVGYLIPTTVIKHFLADIEDGSYDGFGSLGVMLYPGLHSKSYTEYLKVPPGEEGIVVVATMMHSSVESVLKSGDVITKIDDYNIDNDGTVMIHGLTLHMSEVIETRQIGEKIELTFYRDGKEVKAKAAIALNRPILRYARLYDELPRYVCFAGLNFVPVTRNYLETWGQEWLKDMPYYLRYLFSNSMQLNTDRQRKEYVVLAEIMPDEINSYAGGFRSLTVESINGTAIRKLDDVYEAFTGPTDNFHIVKFMGTNKVLVIDAKGAKLSQPAILNKYQIPQEIQLGK